MNAAHYFLQKTMPINFSNPLNHVIIYLVLKSLKVIEKIQRASGPIAVRKFLLRHFASDRD